MKKLVTITAAIAFVLFSFSACKKDHPLKKDESKMQVAVKFQVQPVGKDGRRIGKPQRPSSWGKGTSWKTC